ncbi:amidohydrolase family protein [Amorphus sp. 3PC139-8]|uniref:amidohydrolase family protein n=1 Tax=Amorphus sp. 3PC139-8 TaxID=2735676 RepID=UPI00345D3DEB
MTVGLDLLLRDGLVVDPESGTAERRDLLLSDGKIASVGAPGTFSAPQAEVIDAARRLVLPAFVNSHTHGHASLMKGAADRWTLEASLTNGPWLGGARDPETIYLSTLLTAVDLLSKGCTACYDLVYQFPSPTPEGFAAVAQAYTDAGIKAVLAPMVADRSLYQAIPGLMEALPSELRAEVSGAALDGDAVIAAVRDVVSGKDSLPVGISFAVAPTIPHHCSERFLMACVAIAEDNGLPLHMHVAESRLQVVAAYELYGSSPVAYLERLGVLRPGFTAAHGVWLDEADLDQLAAHGCAIAHIPASNLRLGSGFARLRPMLERGITVGLATDGSNSSDALSMPMAVRLASYGARLFAGSRDDWPSAAEVLRLATAGGADLMGIAGARIRPGAPADLVLFDLDHVDFLPLTDPVNQLVTAADSASIRMVIADGRIAVSDGRVLTVDTSDLADRLDAAIGRLGPALASAKALAARLEPHVVAFAEGKASVPLPIERFIVEGAGNQSFGGTA